jgi:hypothetical protein
MIALKMLCIGSALGPRFRIFVLLPAIFARFFCVYGLWARSRYNDLADHVHECYWRDVFANRIFGRSLAQISDALMEPKAPNPPDLSRTRLLISFQLHCRVTQMPPWPPIARKFQYCFHFICCNELTSGDLRASSCNRTGS